MNSIFVLLEQVNQEPGLYLGSPSVTALRHFLVGYKFSRQEMGVMPTQPELDFYREFQPWLQQHFQLQTTNPWDKILLFRYLDETTAFKNFFQLLKIFQARDAGKDLDPLLQESALTASNQVA